MDQGERAGLMGSALFHYADCRFIRISFLVLGKIIETSS